MEIRDSTKQLYYKIVETLQKAYFKDEGRDWSADPLRFASWFAGKVRAEFWSRRTFWMYRAALIWFMNHHGPAEAVTAIRAIKAHLPKNGSETSSKKQKKLPEKQWRNLAGTLSNSDKALDRVILHWLEAGRYSGLRPCEWEHAVLEAACLTVTNAKRNEMRANGERRTIMYHPERNRVELTAIKAFLLDLNAWSAKGRSFQELYDKCRKRLTYVSRVKKAGMDRDSGLAISLYSPRHQFAADMKASGLTKAEVAALMGHASEDSATIHYARRRDGQEREPPGSPPDEIATVRLGAGALD